MLADGGVLLSEIGAGQSDEVRRLLEADAAYESPTFRRDYADVERIVEAKRVPRS